jgi:hypothetical protein
MTEFELERPVEAPVTERGEKHEGPIRLDSHDSVDRARREGRELAKRFE